MKKTGIIITLLLFVLAGNTQTIVGKWKTIDDETGVPKSIVEIYKKGNKYYGKIVEILDPAKRDKKCTLCPGSRKNKQVLGMEILKDLEKDDDEFEDGTILDPNNGKIYDCKIWLENKNILNVRGYIMFFYRTQEWKRVI